MMLFSAKHRAKIVMSLRGRCQMAHFISDSLVVEATRGTLAVAHGQTDAAIAVRGRWESLTDAR